MELNLTNFDKALQGLEQANRDMSAMRQSLASANEALSLTAQALSDSGHDALDLCEDELHPVTREAPSDGWEEMMYLRNNFN